MGGTGRGGVLCGGWGARRTGEELRKHLLEEREQEVPQAALGFAQLLQGHQLRQLRVHLRVGRGVLMGMGVWGGVGALLSRPLPNSQGPWCFLDAPELISPHSHGPKLRQGSLQTTNTPPPFPPPPQKWSTTPRPPPRDPLGTTSQPPPHIEVPPLPPRSPNHPLGTIP